MIATVLASFVDAPKGREEKRHGAGDVISITKADFERITGQNKDLLVEGKKNLGIGTCYPCRKNRKFKS